MNMHKLGVLTAGLSLLLGWACTEVHVKLSRRIPAAIGEPAHLQAKEPISLAELLERQKARQASAAQARGSVPTSLCDSPGILKDEVRPFNQEASSWCWATSAQTVLEFHKEIKRQCDWVSGALSRSDCCGGTYFDSFLNRWFTATPLDCDKGGWPHWVFNTSGFDYELLMAPGTPNSDVWTTYFDILKSQLCQNGPFISVIQWADGGGHTQVVRGIHTELRVVEVNNHRDADFNTQPFDVFVGDAIGDPFGEHGYAQESFYVEIRRR